MYLLKRHNQELFYLKKPYIVKYFFISTVIRLNINYKFKKRLPRPSYKVNKIAKQLD